MLLFIHTNIENKPLQFFLVVIADNYKIGKMIRLQTGKYEH